MKKFLLLLIVFLIFISCLRITSKPITGDYSPVGGVLPSDASTNIEYNVNIKNLNNHEIIMSVTNELYNNSRENNINFEKNFLSTQVNFSKNTVENPNKIIDMTFRYDYDKQIESNGVERTVQNLQKNIEGDSINFNALKMGNTKEKIVVKAKLIKAITNYDRRVNFWVDETKYSGDKYEQHKINNQMIDVLANKFIGNNQNIYNDLTYIFGAEWFENISSKNYLINGQKTIDILLFDINKSYEGGRVIGYFNPDDLFLKNYSFYSNERVMFYLDAYTYGDSIPWNSGDYWPDNTISTLAHEFMHLITYYQKTILRNGRISTWLNEMLSLIAEELVSYNARTYGPRGVLGDNLKAGNINNGRGRLAYSNYYNHFPVNSNMDNYIEYAVTYSYGAYMLRNYASGENGLNFLRDIVYSEYPDTNAIEFALRNKGIGKDFADSIKEWVKASVLSNEIFEGGEKFKFSTGNGFISTYGAREYKIGDINMYNYVNSPYFFYRGGADIPKLNKGNSIIFYLGKGSGDFSMKLYLPKYSRVQFILKDGNGKFDNLKSSEVSIVKTAN